MFLVAIIGQFMLAAPMIGPFMFMFEAPMIGLFIFAVPMIGPYILVVLINNCSVHRHVVE